MIKFKSEDYDINEKKELLKKFGWYEYYGIWRTPNMSEMGGCDFDTAFNSCLKQLIYDGGDNELEFFEKAHQIYLQSLKET